MVLGRAHPAVGDVVVVRHVVLSQGSHVLVNDAEELHHVSADDAGHRGVDGVEGALVQRGRRRR